MTVFWLWVSAGCLTCAVLGFSAVRVGARILTADGANATAPVPERRSPRQPRALRLVPSAPAPVGPRTAEPDPLPNLMPAPTAPQPDVEKLVLWATQVKAGERKMSIATDGCRVTWNRTCKHGHPAWLVYLGYL